MSSWSPEFDISVSDSEDEGDNLIKKYSGRDAKIFIIDAHLYKSALLEDALVILRSAFLSGLLVNDKDIIGLIFANTENSPEPFPANFLENVNIPEKCAVFLPPQQLNTSIVQNFLDFVETAVENFDQVYGITSDGVNCNFSHLLRLCVDLVKNYNVLFDNTTIVFLTDKEAPHPPNSESYRHTLQKAADLRESDVEFELIPMIDEFNYDIFFKEFICLLHNTDVESFQITHPKKLREMLAVGKIKQHHVRRSLGHFCLSLGPNLKLSAQYFNYYRKHKRPQKVILQRTDNALVKKHRITQIIKNEMDFESDTNEVKDINIKNAWYEIQLGTDKMRLTYEQVNRVRNIHSPGMVLLGFKPRSCLESLIYTKNPNFMYPDDMHIEGSKRLFRALWEKCLEKEKVAICLFVCKRKSMPRYVALCPVVTDDEASTSNNSAAILNNGFKIIYLSLAPYVRSFNLCDWNAVENYAKDQELVACEKLMKRFRMDYKPDTLSDPESDTLQTKLLKLAFNIDYESLGSQYFPNSAEQNQRIEKVLPLFEEAFANVNDAPNPKRTADKSSALTNCAKKSKKNDIESKDYVLQMIQNKTLNSCSKDQLLQILNTHFNKTIPKNTKKQDILEVIYSL